MVDTFDISVKLAGLFLLRHGHISLDDIEAMPFVESPQEARAVAKNLVKSFKSSYEVEVVEDAWNGETTIQIHPATAKGGRTGARHRKPHMRRTAAS